MEMTNEEIVSSYRNAIIPKAQIEILADLNDCSKRQIEEILLAAGENIVKRKPREKKIMNIPETIVNVLMERIEMLDALIKESEKEYREIVNFLGLEEKRHE